MRRHTAVVTFGIWALGGPAGCGSDSGPSTDGADGGTAADGTGGATTSPGDTTTPSPDSSDSDPTGPDPTTATSGPPSVCGDGVTEDLEQCDDGNDVNGDGCEIDCTITYDSSLWQVTAGGDAMISDVGHGIAVDGTGAIVVVGYVSDAVADSDIWVRKYDPAGAEIWTVQLDPSGGGADRAYAVAIDGNDDIYVTGDSDLAPNLADIWIGQITADGSAGWSTSWDGPAADEDGGRGIAVDDAGNVYVTGFVNVAVSDNEIFVGQWAPGGGAPVWTDTVAGDGGIDDRGRGIAVDSVGDIVVGGYVTNAPFDRDVWLRKYTAAGTAQWTVTWDSNNSLDDAGFSIAIAPDDSIGIAGMTPVIQTNLDAWLGKYDAAGSPVWYKQFGAPSILDDNGLAVTSDPDGNFVVAGFKGVGEGDTDIWMRKYDAGGNVVWTQAVAGAGMGLDQARGIATDADGNYVVTGEIRPTPDNDGEIWVAKFAPE